MSAGVLTPPPKPFAPMPARSLVAPIVTIVIVGILAWANGLSGPFVFDDRPAILANPTLDHFATALTPPRDGGTVAGRPLVNLTLWLNRALGGTDVRGYHALNLVIHLGAALALFGLIRRTTALRGSPPGDVPRERPAGGFPTPPGATSLAFAATLLWTVHPLQTAAVTYTVQRAESLAALCLLLTLYAFARAAEAKSVRTTRAWLAASVAACLAGMAAKEVMAVAPVLVLLYDRTFVAGSFAAAWRRRWRFYLALAATWLLLGWLVATNDFRSGTAGFGGRIDPVAYALTQCAAIPHYLRLAFWPRGLVFDYGTATVDGAAAVAPQLALMLASLGATIVALRRAPAAGFMAAAFFLVLAPSSSVVPVATQTMAEHRMYLPLAALAAGGAWLLQRRLGSRAWLAAIMLAGPLAAGVHVRNRDYASAVALWSDTVAKRPENPRAHTHLANALTQAGRATEALPHHEAALRLSPNDPWAHNNLATALAAAGRADESLSHYVAALRLDPNLGVARLNYAQALVRAGRPADAIPHFASAEKLGLLDAASRYNYGVALARTRRFADAIEQFRATLRDDPSHVGALVNLGNTLLLAGRAADAIAAYESALRLRPDDPQIRRNLAQARALAK